MSHAILRGAGVISILEEFILFLKDWAQAGSVEALPVRSRSDAALALRIAWYLVVTLAQGIC